MAEHKILSADGTTVRSLVWVEDGLIDWVGGGARYGLDGSFRRAGVNYAYRFDAAVATTDGKFAVIYERTGTKGLVLREGKTLREINRSFYQAHVYEYPVCVWNDRDGRNLIVHCPDDYDRLEMDDLETGERLIPSSDRTSVDFFHSRLQISPNGTRLLSAGWVWHPFDSVMVFDLMAIDRDPVCLDRDIAARSWGDDCGLVEEISACWQTDYRVVVAGGGEEDPSEERHDPCLHPNGIVVYDIPGDRCICSVQLQQPAGTMMPVGEDSVVAFYEYPRLISLLNGEILEDWPDIPSGIQVSSIIRDYRPPPMAFDPENHRFAVAEGDKIHIVSL